VAELRPGHLVLEVGAGAGEGHAAAAAARAAGDRARAGRGAGGPGLAGQPAEVVQVRFEDWSGPWGVFDLVAVATAWHWVDPGRRYQLAAAALRPGGHLATWGASHVFPPGGDNFFEDIQEVYDAIGEGEPLGAPRPWGAAGADGGDRGLGLFEVVAVEHLDWTVDYDAEG
jgi:SAM-dependent methyltransferase